MRIAVLGLWHLGCVTAGCLAAAGYSTIGIDPDVANVERLRSGKAPLFEPGLDQLIGAEIASDRLEFSTDFARIGECDVLWVTFDTPVDDEDRADVGAVKAMVARTFPHLRAGAVVLISTQLPVGSTRGLARAHAIAHPQIRVRFAYSPENLRLGNAIRVFREAERIVVGADSEKVREILEPLLAHFTEKQVWVGIESAEMVKHGVNSFLALCVTYANEIATLCEAVGADAAEVEAALRLEPRIGPRAYIRPGAPFSGGTLARDVVFLGETAARHCVSLPLLGSILTSNETHKSWPVRRLKGEWGDLLGHRVAVLGLTYKVGTDTLRRSWSLELCDELHRQGARVRVFDPRVPALPAQFAHLADVAPNIDNVVRGAEAVIVATEWPEFRSFSVEDWRAALPGGIVLDPNRFLVGTVSGLPGIRYYSVGRVA